MNLTSDVVVIGGGIVGLCTAYYLSAEGLKVAVIERGEIGRACSDRNAGLVVPSHVIPLAAPGMVLKGLKWMFDAESPFYIKPRLSTDLLAWLFHFWRASNADYMRRSSSILHRLFQESYLLFSDLSNNLSDFCYRHKGLMMLCSTQEGLETEIADAAIARNLGIKVTVMNNHEIHQRDPHIRTSAVGGVYYHQDTHLDPTALVESLKQALRQHSVSFLTGTEVTGFRAVKDRVTSVATSKGTLEANTFVLAGGSWSPTIVQGLGIRMPLQPGKGYSVTTTPHSPFPAIPYILSEAKVAVTPLGPRLRFAGTMELAGLDLSINQRRVDAILKAVPRYLNNFQPNEIQATQVWGGLRPCTPDGLPYIGPFGKAKNLIAATGHAMLGVTLAPVTGKIVTDLLMGRKTNLDLGRLSPGRFNYTVGRTPGSRFRSIASEPIESPND